MRPRRLPALLALALVIAAAVPAAALGDADPASDILPSTDVFLPYSPAVSAKVKQQIEGLVAAAKKNPNQGTAFKVAVIASPQDLGAIPLLGKPQQYAQFLYQEIKTFVDGEAATLLVVMPGTPGAGVAGNLATPAVKRAMAKVSFPKHATPTQLTQGAMATMAQIAKINGRQLPSAPGSGGGSSSGTTIIVIVVAVALALAGIALIIRGRRGPPAPATAG
jgi:hypothetical protein